jgi:tetratricopeptide (TPR) repeat protein
MEGPMRAKVAFVLITTLAFAARGLASDADTKYHQLLDRDDALMKQLDALRGDASLFQRAGLRANLRRLEADYRFFIHEHPKRADALVAFGGFLYDQGREEEGLQYWEKAIVVDPRCAKAYNNLAVYYGHNGRAGDALRYHQKAFEIDPRDPIFHFNWATTCIMFRKDAHNVYGWDTDEIFQHSQEEFLKTRDLEPQNVEYAWAYAESFYEVSKPDWQKAHAAWEFCLRQPTDEVGRERVYSNLARVCIHWGRLNEARSWLEKISSEDVSPLRRLLERRLAELSSSTPKTH